MSRWWNETVAAFADGVPGGVPMLMILTFLAALLVGILWFTWPAWVPRRWPRLPRWRRRNRGRSGRRLRFRLGRLRFRWRWPWRRRKAAPEATPALADDQLPDLPSTVLELNADQLAAAGRYAEAVRERLRALVRDLIERRVLAPVPGWTVTELASVAGHTRPLIAAPLRAASDCFSDIWYGLRPATAGDDDAMRGWSEQVRALLDADPAVMPAVTGAPGAGR